MQRQFPTEYTPEELGSEVARQLNRLDHCQAPFERMSDLAEAVEHAKNDSKRLKRTSRLIALARLAAKDHPEYQLRMLGCRKSGSNLFLIRFMPCG